MGQTPRSTPRIDPLLQIQNGLRCFGAFVLQPGILRVKKPESRLLRFAVTDDDKSLVLPEREPLF